MVCSGLVSATNTFVLRAINNNLEHPYFKKFNICKQNNWLPSDYERQDSFDVDMFGFIGEALREKKPKPEVKGNKHARR